MRRVRLLFVDSIGFNLSVKRSLADAELFGGQFSLVVVALQSKQDVAFLHIADVECVVVDYLLCGGYVQRYSRRGLFLREGMEVACCGVGVSLLWERPFLAVALADACCGVG